MIRSPWVREFVRRAFGKSGQVGLRQRTRRGRKVRSRFAELLETRTLPATIVVTTAADSVNANDGFVSLREAIAQANSNSDSDTITFDASLNGTEIDLTGGAMTVSNTVTITGNGSANTIIDAQQASRIFSTSGTVTLTSLTLKNGSVTGNGGAISNGGNLTLNFCTLTGNSVTGSGGVITSSGTLTITDSTLSSNSATSTGGVLHGNGTFSLTRSTFSSNSASTGGVIGGNGDYTATDCTFSSNSATTGGGVVNLNSSFTATSCLFANNSAVDGGALASTADYSLTNSTFSGNTVTGSGAAISSNSTVSMTNCTVTNNRSNSDGVGSDSGGAVEMFQGATVALKNTIIAGNFTGTGSTASDLVGSASSGSSYNIIKDAGTSGGLVNGINGNQIGVDPLLGSLANNSGTSMTHALLTGSPAINAGSNALVPGGLTTDQRGSGFSRTFATFVDIGAFESQTFAQAVMISPDDTYTNAATITFAFQFNYDVTGFDASDVTVTNGSKGTFTATDARNYTLVVTPAGDGAIVATIGSNVVNEGNPTATATVNYDTTAPTLSISPNGASTRVGITFTFQFSEAVTGFSNADITLSQGTLGSVSVTDADTYTLFVSSTGLSNGPVTVTVGSSTVTDLSGNANATGGTATVTFDNVAPTVSITPNSGTTNANPIVFTFEFSEAVADFVSSDITVTNGTKGTVTSVDADTYTLNVTPTADGTVTVSIASSRFSDAAGNFNSGTTSASVTSDRSPPGLTITPNSGTTNANPITFTFQFTESVTGFDETDITITNGTKGTFTVVDGDTYTLLVTPTASGTVTASVGANAAQDALTNGNAATSASVTSDISIPTLTITPNGTTSSASTLTFTFQFSETVTGFATGDVTVTNGSKGTFTAVDGDTYTLVVTPNADGAVTVDVASNVAADAATNGNTAASATVTSDRTAPSFTSSATITADENQTSVVTVTTTDASSVTYSLNGGADAAKFSITSGGALTFVAAPNRESPTDSGTNNVYDVIVKATDAVGNNSSQNIAVTVADVNEFNPVLNDATFSIAENSANDTTITTLTASDADATKTLEYTITAGNSLGIFNIGRTTGVITVADNTNLDREQIASVVLTVEVSDGGPGTQRTDTAAITINVTGVNEHSPIFTSSNAISIPENTTAVGTVVATDADLPAQTVTYTITGGADSAKFNLTTAGVLTFKAAPNFESPTDVGVDNVYEVNVTANDGNGRTTSRTINVTVTNASEFAPVLNDTSFSIAENSANNFAVGVLTATDGDGTNTFTYSITAGNALGIFSINPSSGAISVASNTNLDREQIASVVLTVQVGDGGPGTPLTDTAQVTINVTGVNDNSPVITSNNSVNVPETKTFVTTVTATDADLPAQTLSYSITGGADQAKFAINATTGVLSFVAAPSFASPTDFDTNNIYEVIVTANDGNGLATPQTINVTVTEIPIYELLVIRIHSATSVTVERTLDDNTTTETLTGNTPLLLDDFALAIDFELPATNDAAVTFADVTGADGLMKFTGTNLRTVTFDVTHATSFLVHGNDGNDAIKISSLDAAFNASIELHGDAGNDTLDVSALSRAAKLVGGLGNDKLLGGSANDTLTGSDGNDSLTGNGGTDRVTETLAGVVTLSGSALKATTGNDSLSGIELVSLTGGSGADSFDAKSAPTTMSVTLVGNGGNDTLIGGAANDLLNGGDDNDSLVGNAGNDTLNGGNHNDDLSGGAGTDSLSGNDGTDRVIESGNFNFTLVDASLTTTGTGGSVDALDSIESARLTGGSGNNTLDASGFTLGPVTLFGGSGNDTLIGSAHGDVLNGEAGNDSLTGNDGDDVLSGGAAVDQLFGNAGNDSLTGEAGNDTFDGGADTDRLVEVGDVNFTIAAAGLTGLGTDTFANVEEAALTGGKEKNTLTVSGFAGPVTLNGAAGDDTLIGGANNDSLDGGLGTDRIILTGVDNITLTDTTLAGQGNDVIASIESATITTILLSVTTTINASSFSGSVTVTGSNGDDAITTGGGNDSILGGLGNDELHGGFGLDSIDAGAGNDCIHGDAGNDKLLGGTGNDTILGGNDNDSIDGGADDDVLLGEAGNDTILGGTGDLATDPIGSRGDDILSGGEGNDSLSGGDGADTILGGLGTDKLSGGNGNDLLSGDADKDTLAGDGGTDTLFGGLDTLVDSLASGETNNQELDFTDETFFTHLDELLAACE